MSIHQPLYSRLPLFRPLSVVLTLSSILLLCGLFSFLPQALPLAHADETAQDLPSWAIGPFTRSSSNPLLTPEGTGFESKNVYNPGVVIRNGVYYVLYRTQDANNFSTIGYAYSTDGIHFTRNPTPVITGSAATNDAHGDEDPRLFESNGTYYTYYTALPASGGVNLAVATSTDLLHWQKQGVAISGTKNGAVVVDPQDHPVKINNQYLMYYGGNSGSVAYSTDLIHWTKGPAVNLPSSYVAIDLVFTDGTALRNLGATDQDGNRLHPAYQCNHLTTGVWNQVISAIGAFASGKTIARLDIGYDQPGGSGGYRGYIDDIALNG